MKEGTPAMAEVPHGLAVNDPIDAIHRLDLGIPRLQAFADFVDGREGSALQRRQNVIIMAMEVRDGSAQLQRDPDLVRQTVDLLLAEVLQRKIESEEAIDDTKKQPREGFDVDQAMTLARTIAQHFPALSWELLRRIRVVEELLDGAEQWQPLIALPESETV